MTLLKLKLNAAGFLSTVDLVHKRDAALRRLVSGETADREEDIKIVNECKGRLAEHYARQGRGS